MTLRSELQLQEVEKAAVTDILRFMVEDVSYPACTKTVCVMDLCV